MACVGARRYFDDSHSSWGYKNGVKWRKCQAGASTGCAAAGAVPRANAVSWLDTAGTEQGYSAAWIVTGWPAHLAIQYKTVLEYLSRYGIR